MLLNRMGHIINHDIKLYARKGGELVTILGFFAIALTLFPFALGAGNPQVAEFAPAFIWIVALLASLLSLPAIFHRDMADGALDQLRLSGIAMEWCVLAKCTANWIACQLPLIFISPLFALMLGMGEEKATRLVLTLLLGTPVLSCIGALGGALTLHAANKSGLLAVLVLPLYIPALIFATILAMSDISTPFMQYAESLMLCGIALAALPLCCWAAAAIIRLQD